MHVLPETHLRENKMPIYDEKLFTANDLLFSKVNVRNSVKIMLNKQMEMRFELMLCIEYSFSTMRIMMYYIQTSVSPD